MNSKDIKNLNTFEDTFSNIQFMKYPKIPAAIAHTFNEYESAESIIKHLFFYILKHYQSFGPSTFLEEDWIEVDPEALAKEMGISSSYLLKKTINCPAPYLSRHAYDLAYGKNLSQDVKNWTDKDRELYDRITQSADPLYDTVLTDALYRMWSQKIKNTKIIERSIHSKWQKIYSEKGFNILERLKITKERVAGGTRITSIKVLLTEDLISDTHLFFIFINPGTYQNILLNSRGQAGPPGLYLHYHVARNLHFYNTENPKSYTQAHIEPFVILCEIAGLKYKKEAKDKDNWRYKNARKSLNAQLQSLVEKGLLLRFEIDKVSAKSRTGEFINVSVWFTPPDEQETQAVEDFMSQRAKMWKEKMLRLYYRRTLVPGVQPWEPHLMDDTEILEKYSNQEYFDQWLANGGYDVEKKKEALNRAYAELFPNARQSPLRISSEIAAMAEAARQRLAQKNVGIIKIRKDLHVSKPKTNTAHETLLETFARAFKTVHQTDYVFSELSPSIQKKAEKLDFSLQQIYAFLTDDIFPKKEFSELIRRINDVTAKASLLYKTSSNSNFVNFVFNYVKTYIFEKYSSMLSQLDEDFIYSIFNSKNLSFSSNSLSWEVDLTYLGAGGFNQNLRDSIRNLLNSAGSALKLKFVLSFQLVKLEQRATYDSRTRILTPTDETFELKYKKVMYI